MANESDRIPHSPARAGIGELSVGEMNRIVGGAPNASQNTKTDKDKLEPYLKLELEYTLVSSY